MLLLAFMFRVVLLTTSLATGNDSVWMKGPLYRPDQLAVCHADADDMARRGPWNEQRRATCIKVWVDTGADAE